MECLFGGDVDYAQIRKIYGQEHGDTRRYSPPVLLGMHPQDPDRKPQEKAHLDVLRRATEPNDPDGHAALHAADQWLLQETLNLCAAVAIHFTFYNSLPTPPNSKENARDGASGLADHKWSIEELIDSFPARGLN